MSEQQLSNGNIQPSMLSFALYYIDHGCFIVPCCPLDEHGHCVFLHTHTTEQSVGKRPICGDEWQHLRLSREEVVDWWHQYPTANIGVLLQPSHLIVLDTDSLDAELEASMNGLPPGPQVTTAKGVHHYYQNTEGIEGQRIKWHGQAYDLLTKGIVIGAGSRHREGAWYSWRVSFEECPIESPPEWIRRALQESVAVTGESGVELVLPDELPDTEVSTLPVDEWVKRVILTGMAPPGFPAYPSRSEALFAVTMALVRAKVDLPVIASVLLNPAHAISAKPREQGPDWLKAEIARAYQKIDKLETRTNGGEPLFTDEETVKVGNYTLTDTGNSERFAEQHGWHLRWCDPWKHWLFYDGICWAKDNENMALGLTKQTVLTLYKAAGQETNDINRVALSKFATQSESERSRKAMLALAKAEMKIVPSTLDTHPWLFNCQNGTLDLRTGEFKSHSAEDYLTKVSTCNYEPLSSCPQWEEFLCSIFSQNEEVLEWLQRALGYSLTGRTIEHVLFLCHGVGANGKSTLLEVLRAVFGTYAEQASANTFLHTDRDTVRNDLAALRSARLVIVNETDQGRRLAESLVKSVTSGDALTARFLFSEYFTYMPEFKIWLATNHKPEIQGTDLAIWRRLRLIPFLVTYPEEQQDKQLLSKLKEELPGILAWLVTGCLRWQQEGLLPTPKIVTDATQQYREEMDTLADFLTECCILNPDIITSSTVLYDKYKTWVVTVGSTPYTQRKFSLQLTERGFRKSEHSLTRRAQWHGLGIRQD